MTVKKKESWMGRDGDEGSLFVASGSRKHAARVEWSRSWRYGSSLRTVR